MALLLSIGGGILLAGLCLGLTLYVLRAQRQGQYVGPAGALQQRRWTKASSNAVGYTSAVHTPNRSMRSVYEPKGVRARVGPVT